MEKIVRLTTTNKWKVSEEMAGVKFSLKMNEYTNIILAHQWVYIYGF